MRGVGVGLILGLEVGLGVWWSCVLLRDYGVT